MKFKEGWINNIQAFKELWSLCKGLGFKYLRTRAVNQDCLENLFGIIRQRGCGNTFSSCYQFIAALKTSVLNNLIGSFGSAHQNCENDNSNLLTNLEEFLSGSAMVENVNVDNENNEFLKIPLTERTANSLLEMQGLAYVSGYLIKKLKILDCNLCRQALLSDNVEPQHLHTNFKEFDTKKRLKYVIENLANYLAEIHDAMYLFLKMAGESSRVLQKIKIAIRKLIKFLNWFPCKDHSSEVECKF